MNLGQAVKMAWKSIWGKKGRSALTILGIFIGIAAVMTIVSVMDGMRQRTIEQYAAMGSGTLNVYLWTYAWDEEGNDISRDYFPDLYGYCNTQSQILGITPQGEFSALVSYGTKSTADMRREWDDYGRPTGDQPPTLYYVSDQYAACNGLTIARGRDLAWLDIEKFNQVCVLGPKAAKLFFGTADPVGKKIRVDGKEFLVTGVYASTSEDGESGIYSWRDPENIIVFPYTARRYLGGEKPQEFIVKLVDSDSADEVKARLEGFLRGLSEGQNMDAYVNSPSEWQQYKEQALAMIGGVLAGIAAISLLVGGIGIMNIMLVTVTERTREIGIRRAIGAQRSSIVAQFLIEAAMLCGIGGIVGILAGTGGSVVLSRLMYDGLTIYPSVRVTAGAFLLSVSLGVLFGSYPAAKAARLQPVEALRAE